MPTQDTARLEAALKAADAAGDVAAASKLAQALRVAREPASPPQTAPKASGGKPARSKFVQDVLGVGEGMFRATVEGPGQLVSAAAQLPFDIYDKTRTPKPEEFLQPQKPSATILKDYNQAVEGRRADTERSYRRHFGEPTHPAATFIGEVGGALPMGFAGSGAPPATLKILETMGRAVKAGAKAGAVGGAIGYQEGADTSGHKALWTAGGGVLGAAIGVIPSVGAGIQTAFRKYLLGRPVADAAKDAAEMTGFVPSLKGDLTAAQETGNTSVQKFLNKNAGAYAQEQLLRQTEKVQAHLQSLENLYGKILPAEEVVKKGQSALVKQRTHMKEIRKRMWNADLEAIRTKVTADVIEETGSRSTSEIAIELPGMGDKFSDIARDFVAQGGDSFTPGFQKILDEYRTFKGSLSFDSLEHLLRLTSGNSGSILRGANPEAQKAAGAQLRRAVFSAIDEMDEQDELGAMLKQMRAGYAARSKAIEDFNNSAAAKILNVPSGDLVANADTAVTRLLKMPDEDLARLTSVLADTSPEVISALRTANIRTAYQKANVANAATGAPKWDLDVFLKETVSNGRLRAAGLYSEGEQEILTRNITSLRALLNKTQQGANVPEVEATAMAGSTLSPAFVTRAIYRLAASGNVDKVLFDPASYARFKQVNTLMQSKKWDEAAYLLGWMSSQVSKTNEEQ